MTVFVGSLADATFCHTVHALTARGVGGEVVDLAHLVLSGDVELPLDGRPGVLRLAGREVALTGPVVARLVDISAAAPDARLRERAHGLQLALTRHLRGLPAGRVVGVTRDNSNFSKLVQLAAAAGTGWARPRSCLTNDPERARHFLAGVDAIYKGASSAKTWAVAVGAEDLARLASLPRCPVLFQERVRGLDVRVHVVGERVFGEAIEADGCDYRTASRAVFSPCPVPRTVAADCVGLTRRMGLVLSGIDFKVSPDGRWWFLEANSAPCFQGYDKRAGGAISDALADHVRAVEDAAVL